MAGSGPAGRITAADVENAASGIIEDETPSPLWNAENNVGKVVAPLPSVAPPMPSGAAESGLPPVIPSQKTAPAAGGTKVSELLGTTVPFNPLEAAVAKSMIDSLAVRSISDSERREIYLCRSRAGSGVPGRVQHRNRCV